jgi:hypothetical protein
MIYKLIYAAIFIFSAFTVKSATYYVNSSTGSDVNAGTSVAPFQSFNKAYVTATDGDEIILTGIFDWSIQTTNVTAPYGYTINKSITIKGQGIGITYIQAQSSAGSSINRSVFYITKTGVTIENLSIRYGYVTSTDCIGGGLTLAYSAGIQRTLTLNNVEVSDCVYSGTNGFSCFHPASAGGIVIAGNSDNGGTLYMNKCIVRNNLREDYNVYGAGGISFGQDCKGYFSQCLIASNSATSLVAYTGDNYASLAGGMCMYQALNLTITNSTFYGNSTNQCGGAIIVNVDVYGVVNLTNNTIVNNSAGRNAGGILTMSFGGVINLKNNIIANNSHKTSTASQSNDLFNNSGGNNYINDNGNNIIEFFTDLSAGNFTHHSNSISGNQTNLFGSGIETTPSIALNGSTNATKTVELVAGSVAINAGSSSANALITIPTIDQRGKNRIDTPDIGSFELVASGLPVELTTFNANCTENGTTINWQTASEHNSAYFEAEKSRDGTNWSVVETVAAAGNSTTLMDYSISDNEQTSSIVYYRLNQFDQDGASKTYGPISVNCGANVDFSAAVFPNPTSGEVAIEINIAEAQNVSIQILGTDGKAIVETNYTLEVGTTQLPFNLSTLNAGIYSIKVQGVRATKTIKMLVK